MNRRQAQITTWVAVLSLSFSAAAAAFQMTEASTFEHSLAADGRVSLENVNGDVTIEAWDQADVRIEAVKKARSQEALDAAEIRVDARDGSIHVETRYDRQWNRGRDAASVDYTLYVPRDARLDEIELVNGSLTVSGVAGDLAASLVNGEVKASGLTGNTEISTVNGRLEVALAELDADRSIELSSVNGSLQLRVPGYAGADVRASTVHGGIDNDFGLEVDRSELVGRKLRGALGGGGARVDLSNVNGSISILQAN